MSMLLVLQKEKKYVKKKNKKNSVWIKNTKKVLDTTNTY